MALTDDSIGSSPRRQTPPATERLRFRLWTPDDSALAQQLWGNPQVTRWIDARPYWSDADVQARLDRELETQRTQGICYWPMFHQVTSNFIGCCGVRPYKDDPTICEFGVQLMEDSWGSGFATEAGRAVIAHAFDSVGLAALFAGHSPTNVASKAMLTKLGFRYTHDEHYAPMNRMHPSYLLRRDESSRLFFHGDLR